MRVSEIIADVRSELVEANASFWSDAELLNLANRAEKDFVQKTRSLFGKATLSTVAGQQDYVLPNNCLSSLIVFVNVSTTATPNWKRVWPTDLEKASQVNENFLSTDTTLRDNPNRYFLLGRVIYFDPIPAVDGSSNVAMFFKAKPTPMATTASQINIDDSLSDAIHHYILWKAWKKEQEFERAAEAKEEYNDMLRQGFKFEKRKAADLRNRIDIDSNRGFDAGTSGFNPFQ